MIRVCGTCIALADDEERRLFKDDDLLCEVEASKLIQLPLQLPASRLVEYVKSATASGEWRSKSRDVHDDHLTPLPCPRSPICDSYVRTVDPCPDLRGECLLRRPGNVRAGTDLTLRPRTTSAVHQECNFGTYAHRCIVCGSPGIADAYYCTECTRLEKDRDGCPKVVNLGASRTDLFYLRKKNQNQA
ncbi:hypothetical protein L7F22_048494 [Adiantum nelumboides]|nr:hypothetical protein [Adiantum nelumboides]